VGNNSNQQKKVQPLTLTRVGDNWQISNLNLVKFLNEQDEKQIFHDSNLNPVEVNLGVVSCITIPSSQNVSVPIKPTGETSPEQQQIHSSVPESQHTPSRATTPDVPESASTNPSFSSCI